MTARWGKFLGIETATAEAAMERAFLSVFPSRPDTAVPSNANPERL